MGVRGSLQDNAKRWYHAIGPISNFTAVLNGCCGGDDVEIFNGGPVPSDCYYHRLFHGTEAEWQIAQTDINQRAGAIDVRLRKQNVTATTRIMNGRSPDTAASAGTSLHRTLKTCVWRSVVLQMSFAGVVVGSL